MLAARDRNRSEMIVRGPVFVHVACQPEGMRRGGAKQAVLGPELLVAVVGISGAGQRFVAMNAKHRLAKSSVDGGCRELDHHA